VTFILVKSWKISRKSCIRIVFVFVVHPCLGPEDAERKNHKKHKNLPFVSGPVVSMINDRAVLLLLFLHHAWLCYFCFSQDSNGLWYVAIENINYSTELSNHDGQVSVYWMYATQRYVVEEKKSKHLKEKEKWRMFVSTKGNLFWYGLLFWLSPILRSAWERVGLFWFLNEIYMIC